MSSLELNETEVERKSKENENSQRWVVDFATGMACRPPKTIRWERIHKNSLNLSGSLPSLNRGDTENHSPMQNSLQKSTSTNTKSTQTPPLSELLPLSSHSCRLERSYCEEIRRREKYHYLSLAHLAASTSSGGSGGGSYRSSSTTRRSSLCLGVTDWHQMGKELRQIADDLHHHRCCRSSTTSLESTSSAESCLNTFSSKTTTMTTSTSTNLHKTATSMTRDDHHLLYRSQQSLSAANSFNDLHDKSNNKSK